MVRAIAPQGLVVWVLVQEGFYILHQLRWLPLHRLHRLCLCPLLHCLRLKA